MKDRKQIAIDFAKSLNHPEIEKIILFGSVARGDDDADSDIDILIITNDKDKIEEEVLEKSFDLTLKTRENAIKSSKNCIEIEEYDLSINRSYYACFYAVKALLLNFD